MSRPENKIGSLEQPLIGLNGVTLPPMVSYAQNMEDVLIRRALQDISNGFYVDLGAFDGYDDSVTRWFYVTGWRGLNVDANPATIERLRQQRPRDVNVWCAVSSQRGTAELSVIGETGLSTISEEYRARAVEAGFVSVSLPDVPTETLDSLLETYCEGTTIDFLKIDVEGSEGPILREASFTEARPRLIVVEAVKPQTLEPAWPEWECTLLEKGFEFAWFDGLNRFYVREEDRWRLQFFGVPPGVFDNFADCSARRSWIIGNLQNSGGGTAVQSEPNEQTWSRVDAEAALSLKLDLDSWKNLASELNDDIQRQTALLEERTTQIGTLLNEKAALRGIAEELQTAMARREEQWFALQEQLRLLQLNALGLQESLNHSRELAESQRAEFEQQIMQLQDEITELTESLRQTREAAEEQRAGRRAAEAAQLLVIAERDELAAESLQLKEHLDKAAAVMGFLLELNKVMHLTAADLRTQIKKEMSDNLLWSLRMSATEMRLKLQR